jgi:glyoxylase-like metal-dependent hydrolase (beta-lactamase superfamily II)
VPSTSQYELDIEQVRQLATEGNGVLPVRLNVLVIAEGKLPRMLVMPGGSFQEIRMSIPAFQVVYEDEAIIVDTAYGQADHETMFPSGQFDTGSFDALQTAIRESRLILVTHEHADHIAGIARSPYLSEIRDRVMLTREQIDHTGPESGFTPEILASFTPLDYERYYRVAPGLVLIKAAGHSPGSQMVYVQLQNGKEYMLLGDVIWNAQSIERLSGRPLLMSLMLQEDRSIIGQQIRKIHDLAQSEDIYWVISHDSEQIETYIQQGVIGDGFE